MPHQQLVLSAQSYDRKSKTLKWVRIFVFQSSASLLLVYGIMCSQYQTPPSPIPANYQPQINPGHSGFQSMCLFLVLCMAGQLTGGFSNPAIAISLVTARNNRITFKIGMAYILADFIGGFLGGLLVYVLIPYYSCPLLTSEKQKFVAFGGQIFGTFLICLISLIVINKQTTYIDSIFWSYIIIPVAYLIARQATNQIDGLNPAVILVEQIFYGIKYGVWWQLQTYWIYSVGPVIGAILAGIFFNIFYLPFVIKWKNYNQKIQNSLASV